ncbi:unnamed protein product [Rotaria sp. Silwood2]|nr:unnamed protein product [Rotaria sp. Silwood2]
MIIEALHDDPHVQNTCYRCLARINSIKDEKVVLNILFFYLKSKSVNVRYVTAKMLLHLSQSSLISSNQVQTALNNLLIDPNSKKNLWLVKDQSNAWMECVYYNAEPYKDVVYSLIIQHLTGDTNAIIRRNELNNIDASFNESEQVAGLASCLCEPKTEENRLFGQLSKKIKSAD